MAALYSFDWLLYQDGRIVRSQHSHFYSEEDTCDPEHMKAFVKQNVLKRDIGVITIQNIKEVRPETIPVKQKRQ